MDALKHIGKTEKTNNTNSRKNIINLYNFVNVIILYCNKLSNRIGHTLSSPDMYNTHNI